MKEKNVLIRNQADSALKNWREQEKTSLDLLKIAGDLRFKRSIELIIFRRDIYDVRPSELLNHHLNAKNYSDKEVSIEVTHALAKAIQAIEELAPCKLDIGKLALEWESEGSDFSNEKEFIHYKLKDFINVSPKNEDSKDVILYGFGRIGRLAARRLIDTTGKGEQLRLKAIVVRPKLKDRREEAIKRASLLQSDSVHGTFRGTVDVSENGEELILNGNRVQLIFANQPSDIDYTDYGIKDAILIDNTGVWRDKEGLSSHLRPGVDHVILTAPGKGDVPNVVYGVNHKEFDYEQNNVLSAASCTTNAIVPAIKVIHDTYGIENGHVESIHSYTNDQNLLDNFHKKPRRGRSAPINMVLTSTGAASAISKVIPELSGKLTGNAVRVPTPNVSLAILNLSLEKETTVNDLNAAIRNAALHGPLVEQIYYSSDTEYVSTNVISMPITCVFDAPSTIISNDGKKATIYLWYDNEYGYTCQVIRFAKHVAKVRRYYYY